MWIEFTDNINKYTQGSLLTTEIENYGICCSTIRLDELKNQYILVILKVGYVGTDTITEEIELKG